MEARIRAQHAQAPVASADSWSFIRHLRRYIHPHGQQNPRSFRLWNSYAGNERASSPGLPTKFEWSRCRRRHRNLVSLAPELRGVILMVHAEPANPRRRPTARDHRCASLGASVRDSAMVRPKAASVLSAVLALVTARARRLSAGNIATNQAVVTRGGAGRPGEYPGGTPSKSVSIFGPEEKVAPRGR